MDPNETMKNLLDACEYGDREAAYSALEALIHWINHDGVLPKVERGHCGGYYLDTVKSRYRNIDIKALCQPITIP